MRYYRIEIGGEGGGSSTVYTSLVNGQTDPGALNVEFDIPVVAFGAPMGSTGALVRIWGVPLSDLSQSHDLNGRKISVFGGMQAGLPLANPQQAGLLTQGVVQQGFGNWLGVNMSLDLLITGAMGNSAAPKNLSLNWKKGDNLATALRSTLSAAFPDYQLQINISDKLVLGSDEPSYFESLPQLASWVYDTSIDIVGGTYAGTSIWFKNNTIIVSDATSQANPKQIEFQDLIGQVTWIGPQEISFSCVMRSDLEVNDFVKLPPGQIATTAASLSQFRNQLAFQGVFRISQIRHVGNFRQSDALAWISTYQAFLQNPQSSAQLTTAEQPVS